MIELSLGAFRMAVPLLDLGAFLVLTLAGFRFAWNAGAGEWDELRRLAHLSSGATHAEIVEAVRARL